MRVVIIGPNLLDQSKGGMHVHAEGCADTKKSQYRLHQADLKFAYEVKSQADIAMSVYDPGDFGYDAEDDDEVNGYLGDIYIFPCASGLPFRA